MTDERFENDKRAILALAAAAKKAGEGMQDAVRRAKTPALYAVASECDLYGHQYDVLNFIQEQRPDRVICLRCGMSWKVER